jgi:hypothetical protein
MTARQKMSRADFRGANGRSQRAARRRGYDHPELWGLTPPRSGKARSPCCWPARTRRSTWPSGMAAIALRWRRSCWFRWPEREGKFERGAVKSSAQKVHHLTAPVFALLQRIADFCENGAHFRADNLDCDDDKHSDQTGDQRILDCRHAVLIANESGTTAVCQDWMVELRGFEPMAPAGDRRPRLYRP